MALNKKFKDVASQESFLSLDEEGKNAVRSRFCERKYGEAMKGQTLIDVKAARAKFDEATNPFMEFPMTK